jgi:HEAT repeat protein
LPLLLAATEDSQPDNVEGILRQHTAETADLAAELFELLQGADQIRLRELLQAAGLPKILAGKLAQGSDAGRLKAAEALAHFPGTTSKTALEAALRDRSVEVRLAAATALGEIAAAPALPVLLGWIGTEDSGQSLRVVDLFVRLAPSRIEEFVSLARDDAATAWLRIAAVEALGKTGSYAVHAVLIDIVTDKAQPAALVAAGVRALGTLGYPDIETTVRWALSHPDWQVRAEAAVAAGRIGLTTLVAPIGVLVGNEVWWVRLRAAEALISMENPGLAELRRIAGGTPGRAQRTAALLLAERQVA